MRLLTGRTRIAQSGHRMLRALRRAASGSQNVLVVMLAIAVAIATLLWSDIAEASSRRALGAGDAPLIGYLLVRPADCRGHLELLRFFQRSRLRGRIGAAGVLLPGGDTSAVRAREWVEREYPEVRTLLLGRAQRRFLRRHGWDGRPALLIVQRGSGAPRLLAPVPMTAQQRMTLARLLEALAAYGGDR